MNRNITKAQIKGIATVIPKEKTELISLADIYGEKTIKKISKATGISEVRIAPKDKTSSDYCIEAAESLFRKINFNREDIDGVVFVTETPDYIIPHTSAIMQDKLGLKKTIPAFDLNYGCAGYVYGLFQSHMLIQSGYCKNVLFCAGDTLSRYVHPEDKALRMVLGDAGSATIVSVKEQESKSSFSFYTDGSGADHLIIPAGASRIPRVHGETDLVMTDIDGNSRTKEHLYMNGMEIMEFALHEVKKVVEETIARVGWNKEDIDLFAFHQANELIVKYIAKQMKLDFNKVPISVGRTGNTSSVSIPLMLCNLYEGVQNNLKKVIVCGFGTGLSCTSSAIDLSKAYICPTREI